MLFFLDRFRKKNRYKIPQATVISIGNLSVGGTGKTPFTIHLAKALQAQTSLPITILSRGYGGKKSQIGMLVKTTSLASDCGDEPLLLKQNLPNCEIIIGANRYAAYQKFSRQQKQKHIVLLDDGFQHHAISRDFDFVLIDSQKRLGNGFTIPLGPLREKPSALGRADCVVFTRCEDSQTDAMAKLQKAWQREFSHLEFLAVESIYPQGLCQKANQWLDFSTIANKKVLAFSGIGNPDSFYNFIHSLKPATFQSLNKKDHHKFSLQDIQAIERDYPDCDYFICTEKDFVKIQEFPLNKRFLYLPQRLTVKNQDVWHRVLKRL